MQFDQLLANHLGDFGPYQKRIYFLACLPAVFCAMNIFCWTFVGADIPHRCKLDENDVDYHRVPNSSLFAVESDPKFRQCFRFRNSSVIDVIQVEPCDIGYLWDNSRISRSALQDWELVCDHSWIQAMVQSVYYVGVFFGSLAIGYFADRFGRKMVLLVCCFLLSLISVLSAWSPNVWVFLVSRLLQGFLEPGVLQVAFVIGIELVGPSKRLCAGLIIEYFFSVGMLLVGIMAYFIRDWKTLQVATSAPGFLFLAYQWLLPESPRWLLAVERREEAHQILRKAATVSGVDLPSDALCSLQAKEKEGMLEGANSRQKKHYTYLDLVRTPNLRRKTLIMCYCWAIVTLVYYGISLNPSALAGDFYTSFVLSALTEFVSITFLLMTLNRLGRRALQTGGFLLSGLALVCILVVPSEFGSVVMGFMLLSKLTIVAAFCTIYLYTSEIFPTVVRSLAIGLASTCARIGGVASPFASLFLNDSNRTVLLVMFGTSSVLAALLTLLLPETTFRRLPETLEDGENFGTELFVCATPSNPESDSPEFRKKAESLRLTQQPAA